MPRSKTPPPVAPATQISRFRVRKRPAAPVELLAQEAARVARESAHAAIATLARIAADDDAPASARVAAASRILDRGYGSAARGDLQESKPLFEMCDEELAALLDANPPTDTPH